MQQLFNYTQQRHIPLIGVSIKPSRGYNSAYPVTDDQQISMMQRVGAKLARFDLPWADTEQKAAVYTWGVYEARISKFVAAGIKCILILGQGNPLYTPAWNSPPTTPAAIKAFSDWSVAALNKFGGSNVYYEVYNEPNLPANWNGAANPKQYGALLSAVSTAMRAVKSSTPVISGGLAVYDPNKFIRAALVGVDLAKLSAIGFHPYTGADEYTTDPAMRPEGVPARMAACKAAIGNGSPPVFNTEQGFELSKCEGSTLAEKKARQGIFAARFVLTGIMSYPGFAIWYDLIDDGTNMNDPESECGLFDFNFNVKPSGKGFASITSLINNCASASISGDGTTYVAKFTTAVGKVSTVTWSNAQAPIIS